MHFLNAILYVAMGFSSLAPQNSAFEWNKKSTLSTERQVELPGIVLEPLTPVGPAVVGEKITGLLINMDSSNGLTIRIRTDRATIELHSSEPQRIQFLSYTTDVTDSVRCGPRNPGTPVTVTYRPVTGALGEPLVIEFIQK